MPEQNDLASALLRIGYYPVSDEIAMDADCAQLIDGAWHMPYYGCDTMQHIMDYLRESQPREITP
jgi:hypothetical protein